MYGICDITSGDFGRLAGASEDLLELILHCCSTTNVAYFQTAAASCTEKISSSLDTDLELGEAKFTAIHVVSSYLGRVWASTNYCVYHASYVVTSGACVCTPHMDTARDQITCTPRHDFRVVCYICVPLQPSTYKLSTSDMLLSNNKECANVVVAACDHETPVQ